jgi:hypothetical protein
MGCIELVSLVGLLLLNESEQSSFVCIDGLLKAMRERVIEALESSHSDDVLLRECPRLSVHMLDCCSEAVSIDDLPAQSRYALRDGG